MDTKLLSCFVAAVECESFTRAAEQMFTTQPNFSKQIAKLERELDCQLFVRAHRTITLTSAGRVFYQQVRDIPDRLDIAIQSARRAEHAEKRSLHIGILEGQLLCPELLQSFASFQEQNPDCEVQISRCDFAALTSELERHRFDLILTLLFTVESVPEISRKVLYPQQLFVAVNRQNPLSANDTFTPAQLAGVSLVILEESCSPASSDQLRELLRDIPVHIIAVNSTEALLTSIEANVGVAIVDGQNRLRNHSDVRLVPLRSNAKPPDFGAAWLAKTVKPEVLSILELMETAFEKLKSV